MSATQLTEAVGLAHRLREATAPAHRSAISGGVNDRIISGTLSLDDYVAMLGQFWHLYDVLELAGDVIGHDPIAAAVLDPVLRRAPLIASDLVALRGLDHRPPPPLPATERYLERLAEVAANDAVAYVAHHYTRYLGDLSGGQFMGRRLAESLELDVAHGVGWYHFAGIPDVDEYKVEYRRRLDGLGLSDAEEARLINEVLVAYELNEQLLVALDEERRGG